MTNNTALTNFLNNLIDPSQVGITEYAVVTNHINDLVENSQRDEMSDADTADLIVASLFEIVGYAARAAESLQTRIDGGPTGTPTVLSAIASLSHCDSSDPVVIEDDDFTGEGDYVSLRTIA